MTPFEVVYGQSSPTLHNYECGSTAVAQVEGSLVEQDSLLKVLKENLQMAQNQVKINADRHHQEQEFEHGDFVYLKLQPFQQMSIYMSLWKHETFISVLWPILCT